MIVMSEEGRAARDDVVDIDARKPGEAKAHRYWVGTFPGSRPGRKPHAYLRDYNPAWEGCVVYSVLARNGQEAKRAAIEARAARDKARADQNYISATKERP